MCGAPVYTWKHNGIGTVVLTMKVKKMGGFIGKRGVLTASRFFQYNEEPVPDRNRLIIGTSSFSC